MDMRASLFATLRLIPWVGAYAALFFVINGALIARIDDVVLSYIDPFARAALGETRYASLLGPLLGHWLGIGSEAGAIIFNAALVGLAALALVWLAVQKTPAEKRVPLVLAVLALTPLLEVLLSWLGKPDPLLIISYVLFAGTKSPLVRNAGIFFMLLAHKEEALVMLTLHFFLFSEDRASWKKYVPGVAGGLLVLAGYAYLLGNPPGRISFVFENISEIGANLSALPIIVIASLNWFWLALIQLFREQKERLRLFGAVSLILVVTLLTIDTTRVAAVISLPLALYVALKLAEKPLPPYALPAFLTLSLLQIEWAGGLLTLTHWHMWPWEQMQYWTERYLSASSNQT